ncbi:hypothetical protein AB0E74_15385 [Streptomyces sp. NPDC030392]|uniref:hypothetical protein n=1 Tax=Streptomyces sp. NPDC030392 TaxID=3155468 RepID=UPI0033C961CD
MPRLLWWAGPAALAGGAVLCVLGWYGASGERFAERQLPYLASGTVPGAALIVAGAVWTAVGAAGSGGAASPRGDGPSDEPGGAFRPSSGAPPVRVPDGTLAHRPDCPLVAGRPDAVPVGDATLDPCPVCEPGGDGPGGGGARADGPGDEGGPADGPGEGGARADRPGDEGGPADGPGEGGAPGGGAGRP